MNPAFHLYRLQQIDTQIDQTEASLAEVNRLLAGDESIRQAKAAAEAASKALHHARQALKDAEFAVKEQQIKIAQSESTLYGGRVQNPKALQDLQKEIASLKKHLGVLEERQLECMLAVEDAENQDTGAQTALTQAEAAFAEKSAGWLGQKDHLVKNLERLKAERAPALTFVPAADLQMYENMRKRKNGVAVVIPKEGSCSACGSSLRPSEVQVARASQTLTFCSFCGRILYAG